MLCQVPVRKCWSTSWLRNQKGTYKITWLRTNSSDYPIHLERVNQIRPELFSNSSIGVRTVIWSTGSLATLAKRKQKGSDMRPHPRVMSKWQRAPSTQVLFSNSVEEAAVHVWYLPHVDAGPCMSLFKSSRLAYPDTRPKLWESSAVKPRCMFLDLPALAARLYKWHRMSLHLVHG